MPTVKDQTLHTAPTKNFFVEMLTRDISLVDAILDLLDNSIDGILRKIHHGGTFAEKPYEGFTVNISYTPQSFGIKDNCGGIPLDIAEKAFKIGRLADDSRDANIPTVGMYGIGMKRAMFKLGRSVNVVSRHQEDTFKVEISRAWMESENWDLNLVTNTVIPFEDEGTEITINELRSDIATLFETQDFFDELKKNIAQHYSYILEKGLTVIVNNESISPRSLNLLFGEHIKPFYYREEIEGLTIHLAVGFNAVPGNEGDANFAFKRSEDDAGWTIMCNDRAVVYNDKSRLTGWGEGVAKYHAQFSVISGIVQFMSNDAKKLPITTTKRGVETSSEIFLRIRKIMIDGLKVFTRQTTRWKNYQRSEQGALYSGSELLNLEQIIERYRDTTLTKNRTGGYTFDPSKLLPKPPVAVKDTRRIVFDRTIDDINLVSRFLFGEERPHKEVGEACFDAILDEAKGK